MPLLYDTTFQWTKKFYEQQEKSQLFENFPSNPTKYVLVDHRGEAEVVDAQALGRHGQLPRGEQAAHLLPVCLLRRHCWAIY